ncbi:protein transport protein Sec24A [Orussus abietinus]|uniref:protein transport protein Sec24A n=1 Tax=Orussus abietinus TaxID=222816 RepID=UPI0006267A5A|nr:protein transport protein Sec24A [Orussus abietinus]
MLRSSGNQFQGPVDTSGPTKSGQLAMVNGQAGPPPHIQNGIQPGRLDPLGTSSSQPTRKPSREASRDSSPTQFINGRYRPGMPLSGSPMTPADDQRISDQNVALKTTQMQSQGSSAMSTTSASNDSAINSANVTGSVPSFIVPGAPPIDPHSRQATVPPVPTISSRMPTINTNHGSKEDFLASPRNYVSSSGVGPSKPELARPVQTFPPTSYGASGTGYQQTSGLVSSNITQAVSHNADRSSNLSQATSLTKNPSQPSQNVNQMQGPQNLPPSNLMHGPPRSQPQTTFTPLPGEASTDSRVPRFGGLQTGKNAFPAPRSVPDGPPRDSQGFFPNPPNVNRYPVPEQQPTSDQMPRAESQAPAQAMSQSQYQVRPPVQQNVFGPRSNPTTSEPPREQNPNSSTAQQTLTTQRKYPQSPYLAQLPPTQMPPTSGPTMGPRQFPGTNVPRQMTSPQDPRSMYTDQMSNVPLDSTARRYPGTYPDHMNQLSGQISNMNVTQAGFDKLWGVETVDLLYCRNVLPPGRVEPPKIRLLQECLEGVNCSPEIFRCTLTKFPETNSLLQKSRLPLGVLIHPFKDLIHLPVIQCSTIVRCRACRTYINPFVYFVDSKRWKCNLCFRVNELPEEFQFDPVTKSYGDPSRRPEVKTSTIEFIAPSEYMLRPPQPAVYLFVLDISRLAVESGYLGIVCNTIAEELSKLPGDGRTQIGFLAIDSAIHFFSMPDNVSQPHEMIMLDVDDVFLPCPDNLIVNLKEREELVRELLAQLPQKYQGTHDTNSALGAGLQAAFKLMSPTGGRITVFQTCLPNLGPGSLQPREDPNNRAGKDVPHLNPATDFYKRLALDCSGQQVAVDLFLLNSQYCDLATLSGTCRFSGGCIYHLPLFRADKHQCAESLERMLRRYLTRKVGFEAVMRLRVTRGLSIHTFHGNFFVRATDLLNLPNINPDAGFGMQISIDESLSDIQNVCFQAALLYTSSKGERRIRVHTLCLPVVANLTDILHSADQQCIVGLLSKMAVDRSQQSSLPDARDALINVAIDVLTSYKVMQSIASGGLIAPGNLKLLPLYIVALLKCVAFRSGTSTRLDDRVFAMCQLKTLPLPQLIQMIYPDLYPVHALDDQNPKDVDGKACPQPPRLHLSAEKLDSRGAFIMDTGDKIFLYVGKNIHPMFCTNVLGVPAFASIPEESYELPVLDTVESERLRNFVFSIQEEKPYYASLQIIREDSHFKTQFTERLIEDRIESALSYYEFLQHLKSQIK